MRMFWNLFTSSLDANARQEQERLKLISMGKAEKVRNLLAGNSAQLTDDEQMAFLVRGDSDLIVKMLYQKDVYFSDEVLSKLIERGNRQELFAAVHNDVFSKPPRSGKSLLHYAKIMAQRKNLNFIWGTCAKSLQVKKESLADFELVLIDSYKISDLLNYIENQGLSIKTEARLVKDESYADKLDDLLASGYVFVSRDVECFLLKHLDEDGILRYLDNLYNKNDCLRYEAEKILLQEYPEYVSEYIEHCEISDDSSSLFARKYPHLLESYLDRYGFENSDMEIAYLKRCPEAKVMKYLSENKIFPETEVYLVKYRKPKTILFYIEKTQLTKKAEEELLRQRNKNVLSVYLEKYKLFDGNDVVLLEVVDYKLCCKYISRYLLSAEGDKYLQSSKIPMDDMRFTDEFLKIYKDSHFWELKKRYDSEN